MRCIDITLGGSRKVNVGKMYTCISPHLAIPSPLYFRMHHCSHLIKDSGGLQSQNRTPSALVLTLVPTITRQKVLE